MFNFKAKEKEIWKVQLSCRKRNNYFSWPRANCKGEKKLSSHMQHIRRVRNPKGQLTLRTQWAKVSSSQCINEVLTMAEMKIKDQCDKYQSIESGSFQPLPHYLQFNLRWMKLELIALLFTPYCPTFFVVPTHYGKLYFLFKYSILL